MDNIDFVVKQLLACLYICDRWWEVVKTQSPRSFIRRKIKNISWKKDRMLTEKGLTLQQVKGDHRRMSKQEESEIYTENKQHKFISCGWMYKAVQHCFFLLNNESGFMSVSAGPKHRQEPNPISIAMTTVHIRSDSSSWYPKMIYFGGVDSHDYKCDNTIKYH